MKKGVFKLMLPALIALGCQTAGAYAADVHFVEPKDGATVSNPVHLKFGIDGMKVAPAGDMAEGTGHYHVLVDSPLVEKGTVIPANGHALHYGKAQTEAYLTLPPGDHKLTLLLGNGAHQSYGEGLSQTITVHVK